VRRAFHDYPLRRILGTFTGEHGELRERLECGHEPVVKSDRVGVTNASRRRCWRCHRSAKATETKEK
jgi:hypothetical protein